MQDDINHRSSSYINIGYKTQWNKLYGAVLKHDTLATTSAYSWGTAVSKNTLAAGSDGWVEYIVTDPSKYNMIGFLDSISPIAGTYTDIDYGFYCATNSLYPIINGVYANQSIISGLTVGTVLRVERIGPVINLRVNGAIVSTITNSLATQKDWKIKGVLHSWANTNLINVGCSFPYAPSLTITPSYQTVNPGSSATITASGCTTYSLNGVATSSVIVVTPSVNTTYTISGKKGSFTESVTSVVNLSTRVQWDKLYGTVLKHDTLATTSAYTWGTAVSKNTLPGGTDGWVEYILTGLDKTKIIGFLDSISPIAGTIYDIDYGFYTNANAVYTFVNSNLSIVAAPLLGTVLRVERIGSVINLRVNGAIVYTTTNAQATQKDWKIKGLVLSQPNTNLINVGCSFNQTGSSLFPYYNSIIPYVEHSSGVNIADGSIKVSPASSGNYTFTWEEGSIVSTSINSKPLGTYKVTMQDDINHRSSRYFNIGYKTQWDKLYGTVLKQDTLVTTSQYSWGTAVSKNTLPGGTDGWVEYILTGLDKTKIIGFLDSITPIAGTIYDIDYGFYTNANAVYTFVNSNLSIVAAPLLGTVLRVERIGSVINLRVNGAIVYTTTNAQATQKDWKIKGLVLSQPNTNLINVGCSFNQTGSSLFPYYNSIIPYVEHSSGVNIADGSIKVSPASSGNYTFTWEEGSIVSTSINSKPLGTYKVTMQDDINHRSSRYFNIGYKTQWDKLYGTVLKQDTLVTTSQYSWGTAVSKNTLPGGTDGWVEYILTGLDKTKIIGFLDSISPIAGTIYDIDYGFYTNANAVYTFVNSNLSIVAVPLLGTVLRVERVGPVINLKVNGAIVYSTTNALAVQKDWKIKGVVHSAANTNLINVGCSFTDVSVVTASASVTNYTDDTHKGQVNLTISGGKPPYNVAWNGVKLLTPDKAYRQFVDSFPTVTVDSVQFKHMIDSLRKRTVFADLTPGTYSVTVYDNSNDSVVMMAIVGQDLTNGFLMSGATVSSVVIPKATLPISGSTKLLNIFYGPGQQITQNVSGSNSSYVVSKNIFNASESAVYNEFSMANTTDIADVGLKTASNVNNRYIDDMTFNTYIHFTGNETSSPLMKIYFNHALVNTTPYAAGDAIGILLNPDEQTVSYRKNGSTFFTTPVGASTILSKNLQLKQALNTSGGIIKNIIGIGPPLIFQDIIVNSVKDVICGNEATGSINFSAYSLEAVDLSNPAPIFDNICNYSVTGPNGYTHSGNLTSLTSASLNNLLPGDYTITVPVYNMLLGCAAPPIKPIVKVVTIAYMPDWVNTQNVLIDPIDHSLSKNAGISQVNNWVAGASSLNKLIKGDNGWIEWTVSTNKNWINNSNNITNGINGIGLSAVDINQNFNSILYGFGIWEQYNSIFYTNLQSFFVAMFKIPVVFKSNYSVNNTVYRLEKNGSSLTLRKNGVVTAFATVQIQDQDLILDASLLALGGKISHPRVSFGCSESAYQFAVLKSSMDNHYYNLQNYRLNFTLDGEYTLNNLNYKVYDRTQTVVASNSTTPGLINKLNLTIGDNRYDLNCVQLATGYYTMEVTNEKNEKLYLRFKR